MTVCRSDRLEQINPSCITFKIEYGPGNHKTEQTVHFDRYSWSRLPGDEVVNSLKSIEKAIKDAKKRDD